MPMTVLEMSALFRQEHSRPDDYSGYSRQAVRHFWQAYLRGKRRTYAKRQDRREARLLDLTELFSVTSVKARHYIGKRSVPIDQIRGSEGRRHDFDVEFNPLDMHLIDRWVSVSAIQQMGQPLPPVVLIQVGENYFVRDGHNRISVARFNRQKEIDAEVTVWELGT